MPAREVVRRPCLGPRGRRPPQPGEEAGQQRQGNHRIRAAPVRRQHVACRRVFPARQRLAINQRDHDLRSIQQPLVEVALAEARHDRLVDDACGIGIGNRAFQADAGHEAVGKGLVAGQHVGGDAVLVPGGGHAADGQQGRQRCGDARQCAPAAKTADQRNHADHQVNQALHDAPGAGRHVEDVLGDEGHADRAEAE
ncbi:hypothetical protein G6F62_014204 [Rhizopus arrhizus]|nr:hypothetical protein G6F62_014204 [Rhizopus arrhizus]